MEVWRESGFVKAAALRRTSVGSPLALPQPSDGEGGGGLLKLFPKPAERRGEQQGQRHDKRWRLNF